MVRMQEYDVDGRLISEKEIDSSNAPITPDIVYLANQIEEQRARLNAAEDALNFLILESLEGK